VELACTGEAKDEVPRTALVAPEWQRAESRTLTTYPEWHIVHAYDDYARVISEHPPHHFGFLRAISGYWQSLCQLTEASAELGEIDSSTRQLVYVIGVSFTFEMLMKAGYEETLGRLIALQHGPDLSATDRLSAEQAAAYAAFLQQVPWYRYDFRADAAALHTVPHASFRDRERAFALGLEHKARAAYAQVIARAVAEVGFDDLTLQMVIRGVPKETLEEQQDVRVLRAVEDGFEVETPRYRVLTHLLQDWANQGADFVDMAGNDQIMFTALSGRRTEPGALASLPRQGYGDTRHLFLVAVRDLAEVLRGLDGRGLQLEHIHDY
jgi:hypothetical protein